MVQIAWDNGLKEDSWVVSNGSEFVEVDDVPSSCYSGVGRIESSILSMFSHSSSIVRIADNVSKYYQCSNNQAIVECLTCGSYFTINMYYPRC